VPLQILFQLLSFPKINIALRDPELNPQRRNSMKKMLLGVMVIVVAMALVCPALATQPAATYDKDKEGASLPTADSTKGVPKNPPTEMEKEGKMIPTADSTKEVTKNPSTGMEKEGKMVPSADSTKWAPKNPPTEEDK
jgi:hypothetical protein